MQADGLSRRLGIESLASCDLGPVNLKFTFSCSLLFALSHILANPPYSNNAVTKHSSPTFSTMSPTLLPDGTSASKTVDQLSSYLREILSSVNKTHLEPPLTESDFDPDLLARIRSLRSSPDELYRNSLDTAFKGALYDLVVSSRVFFRRLCSLRRNRPITMLSIPQPFPSSATS